MARKKIPRICENCNEPFMAPPSEVKKGWGRFCSPQCWAAWRVLPLAVRFQRFVGPTTETGCVLWTGSFSKQDGRGRISSGPPERRMLSAPAAALIIAGIAIPEGHGALHRCDNPPCINVEHLFIGTQAVNMADMHSKDRGVYGENHRFAKLTEAMVVEARRRYASGEGSYRKLAPDYGVHTITLADAIRGQTWKHLLNPSN